MVKRFTELVAVALIVWAGVVGFQYAAAPRGTPLGELADAVVMPRNDQGKGSGVFIAPDTILTAAHVAREDAEYVLTRDGKKHEIKEVILDDKMDVGIIKLKEPVPGARILKVSCKTPAYGEHLIAIGNPLMSRWAVYNFTVAGGELKDEQLPYGALLVQGPALPGLSGSPQINEQGEVVGITTNMIRALNENTAISMPYTGLGLIVPTAKICAEGKGALRKAIGAPTSPQAPQSTMVARAPRPLVDNG